MFLNIKMAIYAVIIVMLCSFGAIFIGVYIVVEKVFFPLYLSMKIHILKNDGDVYNSVEKTKHQNYIYSMKVEEREVSALENSYFANLDTLRKVYLKFIFSKIVTIFIFIILGIHIIVGFINIESISYLDYAACIIGLIFLFVKLYMNFSLLNKVWYKKFIVKIVNIKGIDYHAAYIENRKNEQISLLKKIMK